MREGSGRIIVSKVDRLYAMHVTFSELEYAAKKKVTRRDQFLGEIDPSPSICLNLSRPPPLPVLHY